ncbi:MAG: DUF4962 domain-containing protein [Thermogutta sp.]
MTTPAMTKPDKKTPGKRPPAKNHLAKKAPSSWCEACAASAWIRGAGGTALLLGLGFLFTAMADRGATLAAEMALDESPAKPEEWGFRPDEQAPVAVNPPAFSWRPQSGIASWELSIARDAAFTQSAYSAVGIPWNVHTPPQPLAPGEYYWRYRGTDGRQQKTVWSRARRFTVPAGAVELPMPERHELLARIPDKHPRLFLRPEDLPSLRASTTGPQRELWAQLVGACDAALQSPPETAEPPKYPAGMKSKSEEWVKIWWGNREYTIRALATAARLGFAYQIGGNREYGRLAKRILMDCAQWDPRGATGYRYNDEAGMPYAYYFCRTYTFVYDLLSEEERQKCREVMTVRGREMYSHLCPRHLWQPYASHSNRAWHFLGEVGVTFHGEIPEADDWTYFALTVFFNTYPVWCDDDGGWHEGMSYWASYIDRFTWWADVMRATFGIDAFRKPYFSRAGYYALYLMPPNTVGGGFGDLVPDRRASQNLRLMAVLAAQARNPHWQWYVEQLGGPPQGSEFWDFIRGALPAVEAAAPLDLPTSRVFRGIGQAALNTTLLDGRDNVQVLFKSSPFGLQSHGYDANNSFLLSAYGERLFVSSGRRDVYGSDHHVRWMWSTRSVNNITVDGIGQLPHSAATRGRITAFVTTPSLDAVEGEAGDCYRDPNPAPGGDAQLLDRYTRTILFVKPELVVVFDRLAARRPAKFQYWLHSPQRMELGDRRLTAQSGQVVCPVEFLAPADLTFTQTDQYDPNPRDRIKIREWHVTAETPNPTQRIEFVAVFRPHRRDQPVGKEARLTPISGGYLLEAELADGRIAAILPTDEEAALSADGLQARGAVAVGRWDSAGKPISQIEVRGVHANP